MKFKLEMLPKARLFYRIKYWIYANCANWHDWMHENYACAWMLFNAHTVCWRVGVCVMCMCGLFRPFQLNVHCVHALHSGQLEWTKAKRLIWLIWTIPLQNGNVDKHVYEANKMQWYSSYTFRPCALCCVWNSDVDYWTKYNWVSLKVSVKRTFEKCSLFKSVTINTSSNGETLLFVPSFSIFTLMNNLHIACKSESVSCKT